MLKYEVSPISASIRLVITTDVSNVLTLAWTYRKPFDHPSTLATPRSPRKHHITYVLDGVNITYQNEAGNSQVHTFDIFPVSGHHIVYCSAFDTLSFATHHSLSPILAFEYTATISTLVPGSINVIPGDSYEFPLGSYFLAVNLSIDTAIPDPVGTGISVEKLKAPTAVIGQLYSETGPPYAHIGTGLIWEAVYLVKATADTQSFSQAPLSLITVTGPTPPSGADISIESLPLDFDASTGDPILFTIANSIPAREGDLSMFDLYTLGSVTFPPPGWLFPPGFWTTISRAHTTMVYGGTIPWKFDGIKVTSVFRAGGTLSPFIDITSHWKKTPALPLPS